MARQKLRMQDKGIRNIETPATAYKICFRTYLYKLKQVVHCTVHTIVRQNNKNPFHLYIVKNIVF